MAEPAMIAGLSGLRADTGRVFAVVGVFDGLHRGHSTVVRRLVRSAHDRDARPTVVTFDHHPDEILRGTAPPLLLDPAERTARLSAAGVEVVVVLHFDDELRMTPYEGFIESIASRTELAGFLMPDGSAFGHDRGGTPDAVAALGRARGFSVETMSQRKVDGRPVSSSAIRSAIAAGDLAGARRMLGRSVAVTGILDRGVPASVRFETPFALPPGGHYRVSVGPPIDLRPVGQAWTARRSATVAGDRLAIDRDLPRAADGSSVRVAFAS